MNHRDHGRGDESGPFEPDCPCRGTLNQAECAKAYCGFCRAEAGFTAASRVNDRREDRAVLAHPDSRTDRADRRVAYTSCAYCPPHQGDNARASGHKSRRGTKKPRYKNKRR